MKNYNKLNPEVIVGLGERTVFLEKEAPFKIVIELHIQLEDWLGDDLMECFPCFIVTQELKKVLEISEFTGFEFSEMQVTKDEYFKDNYQLKRALPKFYWMKIIGEKGIDDLYISEDSCLMSDSRFTELILKKFNHSYLDIDKEEDSEQQKLLQKLLERAKKRND
jgi:hypothetical protein